MSNLPFADWQITMDGADLTPKLNPHLECVTLRETRDKEADELTIEIIDEKGLVKLPPRGRIITLKMGWQRGNDLPIGLIDKGQFKIDEISLRGVNGKISIIARSANFAGDFRTKRNHSYIGKTLGQILGDIAARNSYELVCDAALSQIIVPNLVKTHVSDAALLMQLANRYNASGTIKNGKILFTKIGEGKTAKGTQTPIIKIDVKEIEPKSLYYHAADRDDHNGAEAQWHDKKSGQRKLVKHGHNEKDQRKPKRLKKIYHNEEHAKKACESHHAKSKRGKMNCEFDLALGRPDLFPNFNIKLENFKDIISAANWAIDTIETTMGANGLKSKLTLENY